MIFQLLGEFENVFLFQEVFAKSPFRRKNIFPDFLKYFASVCYHILRFQLFPPLITTTKLYLGLSVGLKLPRQTFIVQKHLGLVGELLHYCNPLLHLIIIIHCHLLATLSFCIQVQVQMTDQNHHPNQKFSNSSPIRWGIVAKSIASDNFAE